jgi:signal transduction histidine kinase
VTAIDGLVASLGAARLRLEASTDDPDRARATLEEVAELARTLVAEVERARRDLREPADGSR